MTKEQLEAQDEVLRQAWKEGALNDAWYNKWIEEVYAEQGAKNISVNAPVSSSVDKCPQCGCYGEHKHGCSEYYTGR